MKAADDEVAELEFGDGIRLGCGPTNWTCCFPQKAGAASDAAAIRIEPALALGTPSRGVVGQLILKTLRLIRIDAAAGAAQAAGRALEDKLKNGGGLYRCARDRYKLLDVAASQIPVGRPILVFIHGTFSSTQGSFGDLWDGPQAGQRLPLFQAYDGHVYGFEHRSVSESPIRNAIKLVEALPAERAAAPRVPLARRAGGGTGVPRLSRRRPRSLRRGGPQGLPGRRQARRDRRAEPPSQDAQHPRRALRARRLPDARHDPGLGPPRPLAVGAGQSARHGARIQGQRSVRRPVRVRPRGGARTCRPGRHAGARGGDAGIAPDGRHQPARRPRCRANCG
ncbi:MAG: hypothetical protein MZW92_51995 [Comamonadaceae bacterium]|nr:hypothetical protein [Comamonadaceae bacterium]